MTTPTLTRSPRTGGSVNNLLLQFGAEEIEAIKRFDAAQAVLQEFHCDKSHPDYPEVESAEFELHRTAAEFYEARMKRLAPSLADLIEWVFNWDTFEQAIQIAMAKREE